MHVISREQLQEKMNRGDSFALVEVLGSDKYEKSHLPGAINVPLDDDFAAKIQRVLPDRQQEVVVYCQNDECSASSKAAAAMEELGYQRVFDYAAGKDDWNAARNEVRAESTSARA